MPHVPVNGLRLWYDTRGDAGPPVLLIMGFAGRGLAWRPQLEGLAPGHRLAFYDNRGVGDSERFEGLTSMEEMADDALGLLDHLGWESAHVVGVSMGGMVAQELALRARARVRSLSLIATHAGGPLAIVPPRAGLPLFLKTNFGPPDKRIAAMRRLLYSQAFLAETDAVAHAREIQESFGVERPKATIRAQFTAVLRHDTRDRLHRLADLPTLIVRPEADKLISPKRVLELHRRFPGSRLLNLPGAGHGLTDERREEVNQALAAHIAEVEGAGA